MKPFLIVKSKITNPFIPDTISYEYHKVYVGSATNPKTKNKDSKILELQLKKQIADKLICNHKMIEVVKADNGIIWDFPFYSFKEMCQELGLKYSKDKA